MNGYTRISSHDLERSVTNGMDNGPSTRWRLPTIVWFPLFFFVGLLYFLDVFQIQHIYAIPKRKLLEEVQFVMEDSLEGFLVKTPGCRIPYMDPMDGSVKGFVKKEKQPICNKGVPALFESNLTSLFLVNSSLSFYDVMDAGELKCCSRSVTRHEPKKNENDDKIVISKTCVDINLNTTSVDIKEEFIQVECTWNNTVVYKDFFNFVPTKIKANSISKNNRMNVLIIGLDAVSRLNLHRQMPKTVNYLHELKAVELLGYNKVGDNTFPNLIPVLTGHLESEIESGCWKSKQHFDDCTFLWDLYKNEDYVTSFGEDSPWMGIFNYQRKGFKKQPTDDAYGYFNRISEKKIGNSHNMNVYECIGAREIYKDFLNYIAKFCEKMKLDNLPYFSFYWGASLSHDYLNKPALGDEFYRSFFEYMHESKLLNNTVLIFMSDHGIRWGGIRQTYQGRMEERLPFVFIYLPEWYRMKYPQVYGNLKRNVNTLTTPFDLHETIKDLLNPFDLNENYLLNRNYKKSRGYSLFSRITPKRTCQDAGISDHWCTCQVSTEVDKNNSIVVSSAQHAVTYINHQLIGYAQCANLKLDEVLNAREMTHGEHILNNNKIQKDYMVTIKTLPGEGIFETTVRHTKKNEKNEFEIMGTISRLNLYGQQSACITDFHLKLYCYCKPLLI